MPASAGKTPCTTPVQTMHQPGALPMGTPNCCEHACCRNQG
jgi:hypothetical protein